MDPYTAATDPDLDLTAYADLEDFDSEDLTDERTADTSYLRGMWASRGFRGATSYDAQAENLVLAHGMVQSFINAFARDGSYRVRFDPTCSTAGTDMKARNVVITPAPVADPSLSPESAGLILTGLAVHEISHPRYGTDTASAVERSFPRNSAAHRLSNLLDDIRIERRFVAEYPGYAGIFDPVLDYVGKLGGMQTPSLSEPINLAIGATRYPAFNRWTPETQAEADWWTAWANRWSREDSPKRHVDAIREALRHIAAQHIEQEKQDAQPEPQDGAGQGDEAQGSPEQADSGDTGEQGAQGGEQGAEAQDGPSGQEQADAMSDGELNRATQNADLNEQGHETASCAGSGTVAAAASEAGIPQSAVDSLTRDGDAIIEQAEALEDADDGHKVDVCKSMQGITDPFSRTTASPMAMRYIRNALLASRTGHDEVESHHKQGRLDGRGLTRIGFGDARVFEKRRAMSPGRYLIWVLVDCSGSMRSQMEAAAQVAHSLAAASQGVQSMRMAVYGWSDPFRQTAGANSGAVKAWETGEDPNQILAMPGLHLGGTPDSATLNWARRAILRAKRGGETPVIIMVSDGEGYGDMNAAVEKARKAGIVVRSVSFGAGYGEDVQLARYGRGNYVAWAGSIMATARPLAQMIAKLVNLGR